MNARTIGSGWGRRVTCMALAAGLAVGVISPAFAQPKQDPAPKASTETAKPMQAFLAIEHAAWGEWLQSPKDAELKKAFALFPQRLKELPGEIPDMPPEAADVIGSLAKMVVQPGRFAITYTPNFTKGGAMGYGLLWSSRFPDQKSADAFEAKVLGMIGEKDPSFQATESDRFPSLTEVVIPVAPLRFGSRQGANGSSYDVIWGAVTDADAPFEKLPKGSLGGKTLLRGSMDFRALGAIINFAQTGINGAMKDSGQAPVQVGRELAEWGLIGNEALQIQFESAYVDGAVRSRARMDNVQKLMEQLGTETGGLSEAQLAAIPADATSASMTLISTKPLLKLIGALRERFDQADEGLAQFTSMTGVDLEKDLLPSIGGTMGFYTSESTGGGGPGSMVALMGFTDRAKFLESHDKLVEAAKEIVKGIDEEEVQMAQKYVRLRTWKSGNTDVLSLTFPGVPVPLEISYAATEKWFVMGLTPQAVVGALAQIEGKGDKGIATRADLAAHMPKGKEVTSIAFKDTARSMRDGYTIASMFGSAVANAMRSPHDESREPGILVPAYKDLIKNVKNTVQVSYREGESIVVESVSDGSMLVGLASTMGEMNLFGNAMSFLPPVMERIENQRGMRRFHEMEVDHEEEEMGMKAIPVPDRIALVARGLASGPTIVLSPEQWMLWGGVVAPELAPAVK